MIIFRYIRI